MDYLGALTLIGSGPQGKSGREILAGLPEPPEKLTEAWCKANAAAIDAWLTETDDGGCTDEAARTYAAVKPLLRTTAVRRLRMMATDCHSVFPDCTFRAVVKVAEEYNRIRTKANYRALDRVAAKLTELCKLYALQVRLLLKRHSQLANFVTAEQLAALRAAAEGGECDRHVLCALFGVPMDKVDHELHRYLRRADDTLWVLKGDPL